MAIILCIETATKNCSVGLSINGVCVELTEKSSDKFVHAELLHTFISKTLDARKIEPKQLDAVCVSDGPGSYTGLRIGVSAAKGLCYSLNIPMIALNTNDILVNSENLRRDAEVYMSVIDARRNEVYARFYNENKSATGEIEAVVLDKESFAEIADKHICVVGDAAGKTAEILAWENLEAIQEFPSAKNMASLAEENFAQKQFVDVAYHEPFYLKDFIAGKPKKLL